MSNALKESAQFYHDRALVEIVRLGLLSGRDLRVAELEREARRALEELAKAVTAKSRG